MMSCVYKHFWQHARVVEYVFLPCGFITCRNSELRSRWLLSQRVFTQFWQHARMVEYVFLPCGFITCRNGELRSRWLLLSPRKWVYTHLAECQDGVDHCFFCLAVSSAMEIVSIFSIADAYCFPY